MGTLETYNEVAGELRKRLKPDYRTLDNRTLEIVERLKDLGLFVRNRLGPQSEILVDFRGRVYCLDQVDPRFLSFRMDIGECIDDSMYREQREELEELIRDMNAENFLVRICLYYPYVELGSSQYLGERDLTEEELRFVMTNMDQVAQKFWEAIVKSKKLIEWIRSL